jgi:hypothetical protein
VSESRVLSRAIWTLPAAGVLLGIPWLWPWFADSADLTSSGAAADHAAWARIAASDGYLLFGWTQGLGLLCLLFGLFALYGRLARGRSPRWATAALILGVTGIVPALMILGILAFAAPILATFYQNGIDVCPTSLAQPGYLARWGVSPDAFCRWSWDPMSLQEALVLGFIYGPATALTLAVAVWRSGLVSKWVAAPFGVAYYLCLSAITPNPTLVGGLLMIVVGGWIAVHLGRESETNSV